MVLALPLERVLLGTVVHPVPLLLIVLPLVPPVAGLHEVLYPPARARLAEPPRVEAREVREQPELALLLAPVVPRDPIAASRAAAELLLEYPVELEEFLVL